MQNPQYRNTLTQNGQVFDLKTKDYMGKSIDFGKRRVFKDKGGFRVEQLYGFASPKGDTTYYNVPTVTRSKRMASSMIRSRWSGAIMRNFDEEFMKLTGIKRVDIPKDMGVEDYYQNYYRLGKEYNSNKVENKLIDKWKKSN